MSEWVQYHLPCSNCGSSDGVSVNDKGWAKCFVCGTNSKVDGEDVPKEGKKVSTKKPLVPFGEYRPLTKRKISEDTCKKFGYFIGSYKGKSVQVAPYKDADGSLLAQKVRFPDKSFLTTGDFKKAALFGQSLWGEGGKRLVITEGEIDCMTVSQLQGNKWPVVSIPNGAQGATNSIKQQLEWVMSYDEVVIMFDMDDAGRKAAIEVANLLPPGKAKIAALGLKDPNEMLLAGRGQEVIQAIWNAKEYRPDGIVDIEEIIDEIGKEVAYGLPWFLKSLTDITYGRQWGFIYGFGAGTGVGKTDLFTEQMAFDIETLKMPVGAIFLESKPVEVGKRLAGKIDSERYHIPEAGWSLDKLKETLKKLKGNVTFYDNWGDTSWEVVKAKIRYMVVGKGIKLIYLDHLTAMADTSNEKESIEQMMKEMAGLANELGCIIHFISHLSTPEGKPHEEGGRVMIKHFKGSRAIGFWAHGLFGLERNQQAKEVEERQTTTLRVLKDRYTGQATGKRIMLGYNQETGRLFEKGLGAEDYGFDGDERDNSTEAEDYPSDF